jgi:hypothetical protein
MESQQYPFTRYVEQIDYKTIIVKQIDFIHQGVQYGSTTMIKNGIMSLELLLSPMLDEDATTQIADLNTRYAEELAQLAKIHVAKRAYDRRPGQLDPDELMRQKQFELQQEKYKILLAFAKKKDLLMAEVETEEF